jgi:hypothetical protein
VTLLHRWFGPRRRLTVSFITRDSEPRLARAIAQARRFADEVVVGVDAGSQDRTWELACDLADTVYRFTHPRQLAPAHMLALRYCRGDWILRLDDDEYMEVGFEKLLPSLLATPHFTHYFLARKMVVSEQPPLYLHEASWYPNFVLRLFRNDASLIWKPPRFHSGYYVAGQGAQEARSAILHYEPLLCSPEQRERKLKMYREGGGGEAEEAYYRETTGELRAFNALPHVSAKRVSRRRQWIDTELHALTAQPLPQWGCNILAVDLPARVSATQTMVVTIQICNTGAVAWMPHRASWQWPQLNIAFHVRAASGDLLETIGGRIPIAAHVAPGATTQIVGTVLAPAQPGSYVLSWDLFSEGECWFEECGHTPFETPIEVLAT